MRGARTLLVVALSIRALHVALAVRSWDHAIDSRDGDGAVSDAGSRQAARFLRETHSRPRFWEWRRVSARLGIQAHLGGLVLDSVPFRYSLVLIKSFPGEIQVWEMDPSASRARLLDNFTTGSRVFGGDPVPVFLPGERLLFVGMPAHSSFHSFFPRWPMVWDVASHRPAFELREYGTICGVSPGGDWVVVSHPHKGSAMWNSRTGFVLWRTSFWCGAAAFSPLGDMVAVFDHHTAVVLQKGTGAELCRKRWAPDTLTWVAVVFTEHNLLVCDWWQFRRSVVYSFRRSEAGCELVGGPMGDSCTDIAVSAGEALMLKVSGDGVSVSSAGDAGDGEVFGQASVLDVPADSYLWGRLSPDGRTALLRARNDTHSLWQFAEGRKLRPLPQVRGGHTWTFSDDGEVLVAIDTPSSGAAHERARLRFVDASSGEEFEVSIDPDSRPALDRMDHPPWELKARLSGLRRRLALEGA